MTDRRDETARPAPEPGVLQWFWTGEQERVEEVLSDLRELGVTHLRTGFSWADWFTPAGRAWYAWLLPRLAEEVEILPCFLYTPPSLGVAPKSSAPPREPRAYADFLDEVITEYGGYFDWVELWNEPNNLSEWDWTLDPEWRVFCQMIGGGAYWARARGKKTVLGGMSPTDPHWLRLMFDRGVMQYIDAVGIHGFPGIWESSWEGWPANVRKVREVLDAHESPASVWITEVGFSTWRHEEHRQVQEFVRAAEAPVDRIYWYSARDLDPDHPTVDGFHADEREYHFGLTRTDGTRKLLYRAWAEGGVEKARRVARIGRGIPVRHDGDRPILVTGGAGFIGARLAEGLLSAGEPVTVFDSLTRPGTEANAERIQARFPKRAQVVPGDVRDRFALRRALDGAAMVYHLASPAAAGEAEDDVERHFDVTCRGTLNLLHEIARQDPPPDLVFVSRLADPCSSAEACARTAAEAYVLERARRGGFRAAVLRLSEVYGLELGGWPGGWSGSLALSSTAGEETSPRDEADEGIPRDLLSVEDAVRALDAARLAMDALNGAAYAVTGGPVHAMTYRDIARALGGTGVADGVGPAPQAVPGDRDEFQRLTGWSPRTSLREGLARLHHAARAWREAEPDDAARRRNVGALR